ncbi:MAG: DMT family transporter [Chloroflexota bacterium]
MNRSRAIGITLVVVNAVAYGSGGLFARPAYAAGIDWLTLMAWRFGIAGALSWVLVAASPSARAALRSLDRRSFLGSVLLGVWFISNTATYYAGIATVPLSLAGLIVYIYPPVVAVLAVFFGLPLEGRRAWTALAIAVVGVVLAVGGIDASKAPPVGGLLLVLAAPLLYSGWIILAARHTGEDRRRTGAEAVGGNNVLLASALLLSTTGISYWTWCLVTSHPVLPGDIPAAAWPGILGVAVIAGFLAPQAFYAGAQRVGAAQASLISTVEPLWTIVAAGVVLGERLEPLQWMGGAMILFGVLLSQTRGRRPPTADEEPVLPQPLVHLGEE